MGAQITTREAADILGVSRHTVHQLVHRGVLSERRPHKWAGLDRDDVERVALQRWRPAHPYWVTTREAAEILEISKRRVLQLVQQGSIPAVRRGRWWLYRRPQLEVIANARLARRCGLHVG